MINRAWAEATARLGLTLTTEPYEEPSAVGEHGQRPAQLYQPVRLGWWRRTNYTRLTLTIRNRSQIRLKITAPKPALSFLSDFSKSDAVHTGSDAVDGRFAIWGSPQPAAAKLMADTALQALLLTLPRWVEIEANYSSLSLNLRGEEQNVDLLVSAFTILDDLANRIEGM